MDPLLRRRSRSIPLALGAIVLAGWAVEGFLDDARFRSRSEEFARRYTLDRRRPLELAALRLERTADGSAAVAVDAALEDASVATPPGELDAETQRLWADSVREIGEELESSRLLLLDAARRRPGRAQHRLLLGQVQYALDARSGHRDDPRKWIVPFELAASAAPGLEPVQAALGAACLQEWARLSPDDRRRAPGFWGRAFQDPAFVRRSLLPIGTLIGEQNALALVPEQAEPLRAAYDTLTKTGDLARAAALRPRLDRALRAQREEGLKHIASRREAGDLEGARSACLEWLRQSPAFEFDDPPGRTQTARLVELWPNDTGGSWRTDPRGELVRFFLNRREHDVSAEALVRTTDALTAVPDTVRARVRLLAGDYPGADEIRQRTAMPESYDWVPYLIEVARAKLSAGDAGGARAILKSFSAAALEGCDALLLRRDVARSLGDAEEVATVVERLTNVLREALPAEVWSASGSMSICFDEKPLARRRIRVAIDASAPVIVGYGWNGGREGSLFIPAGASAVNLPVPPLSGRQTLSVFREAGGTITLGAASLEGGASQAGSPPASPPTSSKQSS
jgi:hypothetical protein